MERCHCGLITYEAEIDPEGVGICHCTDCQTLTGTAFRTFALTYEGGFTLLSGELKAYVKVGESGTRRLRILARIAASDYATSEGSGRKIYSSPGGHKPAEIRSHSTLPDLVLSASLSLDTLTSSPASISKRLARFGDQKLTTSRSSEQRQQKGSDGDDDNVAGQGG